MNTFSLLLNSPEVTLTVDAVDCTGAKDPITVVYRRHAIKEAQQIIDELAQAETELDSLLDSMRDDTETKPSSDSLLEVTQKVYEKQFAIVSDNVLDFLHVKVAGSTLPSLLGADTEGLVTDYMTALWAVAPYRMAVRDGLYSALRNTL